VEPTDRRIHSHRQVRFQLLPRKNSFERLPIGCLAGCRSDVHRVRQGFHETASGAKSDRAELPRYWFWRPRCWRNQQCSGTLLSRRWNNVSSNLYILAQDGVAKLTIRTPQRKLQCTQSPHLSFGSVNAAVYDPGGGRTMINQHKGPPFESTKETIPRLRRVACSNGNGVC